jgi:hypothetical protein
MEIIRIFNNALGGKTLYLNKNYISPKRILKNKIDNYKKRKLKNEE